MVEDDVVEEHNGVYSGKWHIVSPEGFDLPEGLDYLKNSWEGNNSMTAKYGVKRIHKYDANIKVSNIQLGDAFERLAYFLRKFRTYETNLEIEDCIGNLNNFCLDKIYYFMKDLIIHGCQLTFRELASIMAEAYATSSTPDMSITYNLSDNIFTDRDPDQWNRIKHFLALIKDSKTPFKLFDLRGCNFSEFERKELMQEAGSLNLLI